MGPLIDRLWKEGAKLLRRFALAIVAAFVLGLAVSAAVCFVISHKR